MKASQNKQELKSFGIMFGSIVALLFGLLIPVILSKNIPYWPWIIAIFFIIWSLTVPMSLIHFYKIWMKFGYFMGWINTRLILFIMFYLMFFPIGLIIRIFGKDLLRIKFKKIESYREKSISQKKDHLRRPY